MSTWSAPDGILYIEQVSPKMDIIVLDFISLFANALCGQLFYTQFSDDV